jgi:predicted ATP-binding protein involved in virulence
MLEAQQNEHQVLKIDIRGNITKFAMVIEMAGVSDIDRRCVSLKPESQQSAAAGMHLFNFRNRYGLGNGVRRH